MARVKLSQIRLRSRFFKKKKNSNNNNGQDSIQKIDRAPSSPEFAAQNSAELGSSGAGSYEPARTLERPRLPKKFLDAVAHLGIKNAVPKTIMQLKNDDGDNNGGGRNKNTKKGGCWSDGDDKAEGSGGIEKGIKMDYTDQLRSYLESIDLRGINLQTLPTKLDQLMFLDLSNCSLQQIFPTILTADADGDADNDGGDDRDNNGGGGDKNKKKGGGLNDGEGNGDGGDKAEGGDGEEKGMNKDCMGQLGFGYRCTYHAGYENGYPVELLHALIMFYLLCSENTINYCSIMPPVRDVSLMILA